VLTPRAALDVVVSSKKRLSKAVLRARKSRGRGRVA
jgi:hypothetical protein